MASIPRFRLLGWQDDLLAYKRLSTKFDIGEVELPFHAEIVPIGVGETCAMVAFGLFGVGMAFYLLSVIPEQGFTLKRVLVSGSLAAICLVASFPFLLTLVAGRRRQAEVSIDREAVEVTDRPPLREVIHWREPLSHYTGVRCHVIEVRAARDGQWADFAAYALDLDHPLEQRVVPLYRSDASEGVEERWSRYAQALGLPKTGAFPGDLVTRRMYGIPLTRSGRSRRKRAAGAQHSRAAGPLLAGAAFGIAGLGCALVPLAGAKGEGWSVVAAAAGVAAVLTGAAVWKLLAAGRRGRAGALLAGALAGLLAHPLAWYLASLQLYLRGVPSSLGDAPMDPVQALGGSLVLSLGSWIAIGWLTLPAGMLVGLLLPRRPGGPGPARPS